MKKILLIVLSLLLLCSCNNKTEKKVIKKDVLKETVSERVDKIVNSMTLEEKIGQMIIIDYRKPVFDEELANVLEQVKPGGIILFSENFESYNQSIDFIKQIKGTNDIPLFISIDQEGGKVQRLKSLSDKNISLIPSMNEIGNIGDERIAYEIGTVIAEELRVFGINMDFAPVIDTVSNSNNKVIGNRSFGSDYNLVSKMGISLAKGLSDNNIIPVYKHFPGHGNTKVDSHNSLPIIKKTKEELMNEDLIPFKNVIENDAEVIMIGHLAVPSIDASNTPASLSKLIITDFLKNELGFNGLVITDALNMKSITKNYSEEEIYLKAVESGVDILLMPENPSKVITVIKDSIESGTIDEKIVNESVKKIIRLKYEKILDKYEEYLDVSYLNSEEHNNILKKIN